MQLQTIKICHGQNPPSFFLFQKHSRPQRWWMSFINVKCNIIKKKYC